MARLPHALDTRAMIRRRARERWGRPEPAVAEPDLVAAPGAAESDPDADQRLMGSARLGDVGAFNKLVDRHTPVIFNVCMRLLRDGAAAEDATQDTFLRAWGAIEGWQGGLVRPWLIRIATNRCYDLLRSQARRPAGSLDAETFEIEPLWSSQAEAPEDPEYFAARVDLSTRLERALASLPDDQRLAIILADVQGLSYEEVAQVAGVATGTVKSRISRGRGKLRDILRDTPGGAELFGSLCRPHQEEDPASR